MGPEDAVEGILNISVPGETVVNDVTTPPPIVTTGTGDSSFRPEPVSVTVVPFVPIVGEKFAMVGRIRESRVDCAGERIVPVGGDTVILPVDAFGGTVKRMMVLLEIV